MTTRKSVFDAARAAGADFNKLGNTAMLDDTLDRLGVARDNPAAPFTPAAAPAEPSWLLEARKHMGVREVPGPRHNPAIVSFWKLVGRPYTDDETPWCGGFVAYCMSRAGVRELPAVPERAKAWASWGKPCNILLGAVAVFGRKGGGHVGFVVGTNGTHLYILGGNQSNAVNIMPIDKNRLIATRWPSGVFVSSTKPPLMFGGVISTNEA